jgi:membrane fusion protein (multidrug efflux system)
VANQSRIENETEAQTMAPPTTQSEETREPWPEETEPARKRGFFSQHPHARWLILFVLIALVVAGILVWRYYSAHESTDDAQIDGHIGPISSRIAGTVIKVYADDNQFVQAGQVLVQLDPKDYQVALDRAKADLADLRATADAAQTGVPITSTTTSSTVLNAEASIAAVRQQVDAAQARSREAEANYVKVAADLKRAQMLIAKDEISQQQYDAAVATEKSAAATVEAAHSSVAAAQAEVRQAEAVLRSARTAPQQLRVTQSHAASAEAAAQRAQAAVVQADLNLQYTTIRAPYDGILSKRNVEPGQTLQPGQPTFSIVDISNLWVTANYKETQLHYMKVGQPAKIHVDTYNRDYNGHVESMGGATGSRFSLLPPENATGNYVKVVQRIPVRIAIDKNQDPNHLLRPGMSVEPNVTVK